MDGTLLNSASRLTPRTVDALRAALARPGKTVMVATGKCRPAALAACRAAGLAGERGESTVLWVSARHTAHLPARETDCAAQRLSR